MEKKVAAVPSIAKIAMATKLLLVFGVVGLATALGGYVCNSVTGDEVSKNNMRVAVEEEMALAKSQLKRELAKGFEEERANLKSSYSEDSFVKFSLIYPASWLVSHGENEVKFYSSDKSAWFYVVKQNEPREIGEGDTASTTEWRGYRSKIIEGAEYKVVEVYQKSYKNSDFVVEISGDKKNFDEIAKTLSGFELK